jgi:hypothetical protein
MALILNGSTGISTTDSTTPFVDGSIGTAQLANDSVTTQKIASGSVGTSDLADNAVTTAKIADANVTEGKIADGAVTTNKLSNSGVTAGTYTTATVTVDAKGRVTSASSGSGGGVTSLNGQTGAITNTNFDSIGSYVVALYAINAPGTQSQQSVTNYNTTVAGSSLRYNFSTTGLRGAGLLTFWTSGSNSYGGGGSSLSGTWRLLSYETRVGTTQDSYGQFNRIWYPGLWVRIS